MKSIQVVIFFWLLGTSCLAQEQNKVFLNSKTEWTFNPDEACEYALITYEAEEKIRVNFYTLEGREKGCSYYKAYTPSPKDRIRHGKSTYLYSDGTDSLISYYRNGELFGQSMTYYKGGAIHLLRKYKDGKVHLLTQYYPSGALKREEVHIDDHTCTGNYYAEDGTLLPFVPYLALPKLEGGGTEYLMKLLSAEVSYPKDAREAGIQGRVIIRFIVNKEGKMENPRVIQRVCPSLDREALRVFNKLAPVLQWTIGMEDGEPIRVAYTVPIMFRLQ